MVASRLTANARQLPHKSWPLSYSGSSSRRLWAWVARHPVLYGLGARFGVRYLKWLAGDAGTIRLLPTAPEWTRGRDFPAPQGRTFREMYAARRRAAGGA